MTRPPIEELKKRLDEISPDCGDNSCRFAVKRGGMRTNGGCRCTTDRSLRSSPKIEQYAVIARTNIPALLDYVEMLEAIVKHARTCLPPEAYFDKLSETRVGRLAQLIEALGGPNGKK